MSDSRQIIRSFAAIVLCLSVCVTAEADSLITSGDATALESLGSDIVAIAAGYEHSLALRGDGSVAAWGKNDFGQAESPAGNDFIAIAAGGNSSLALRSDGSIAAWG
ncbi:MAG: hypothetical protein ACYTET_06825, partial [Planctomycetota bacterium]